MDKFIAKMIKVEADKSLELGQDKYRAYFLNTSVYEKWQASVDMILISDGYEACIVSE